ncbi:hypothetical protein Adi01nite_49650 [Amorphoplanes digitatis]|nr:hypothetical protein Adi01nite_49650 [Actinoplanes digitatis]
MAKYFAAGRGVAAAGPRGTACEWVVAGSGKPWLPGGGDCTEQSGHQIRGHPECGRPSIWIIESCRGIRHGAVATGWSDGVILGLDQPLKFRIFCGVTGLVP